MLNPLTPARGAVHRIDPADDVAVAIRQLEPGETVALTEVGEPQSIRVRELIPRGHKVALRSISAGSAIRKYGWPIGQAKRDIPAGSLVHTENLTTLLTGLDRYEYQPAPHARPTAGRLETPLEFMGYRRPNG